MITNSNKRIETTVNYNLDMFTPMNNHPFQVRDDSDIPKMPRCRKKSLQELSKSLRHICKLLSIVIKYRQNMF